MNALVDPAARKDFLEMYSAPRPHWVGNGFPVRSFFSYLRPPGDGLSPFLLLDYIGPSEFEPSDTPRGIGAHPHRGFEAVTLLYRGELTHLDSNGESGLIGAGDVQWFTTGSGVVHEIFHSERFTRNGGILEMLQLWVNLPAAHKNTPPRNRVITANHIPSTPLPNEAGLARVIAGEFLGVKGPAPTFSPLTVLDMRLREQHTIQLPLTEHWQAVLVVLHGAVQVNGGHTVRNGQMAHLGAEGDWAELTVHADTTMVVLTGADLAESVAGFGPFVMNTQQEISDTFAAFNAGEFGTLPTAKSLGSK